MDSLAILQKFGQGDLIDKIADALSQTAQEVIETKNPGSVTVKLVIKTETQGDPIVIVVPTVSRTTPKREAMPAFFYAQDGTLYKDDPRQPKLIDLRRVDTTTGEIIDVEDVADERSIT